MRKNKCFALLCCLSLTSLASLAQQIVPGLLKEQKQNVPLEYPLNVDSSVVPVLADVPSFPNFNFTFQKRLDSIQKSVPLPYNEFVQKYIDIYSSRKSMIGKMLGLSGYYFPIFEKALKAYNIPLEIKYLPIIESAMDPYAVSRVGATGLWQFMFTTAKGYGLNMDNYVDERRDPIQASYAAAAYFSDAYTELGDWLLAIAAYNCGMGNVNRAIAKAGSRDFWEIRPFLPLETRNYVPAFIAAVYVMNCSGSHGIKSLPSGFSGKTDTVHVNRYISLPKLAAALNVEAEALCLLNPSYKKKVVNGTDEHPKRLVMPRVEYSNYALVYDVLNAAPVEEYKEVVLVSQPRKPVVRYHKVKAGQNLSVIADQYRIEVQDLKVWNKLKSNNIVPGQRLIVGKTVPRTDAGEKSEKQFTSAKERSKESKSKSAENI